MPRQIAHMLSNAVANYKKKYTDRIDNADYYLYWLENDILLELNENCGLIYSIKPNVQKAYPNLNCYQINEKLNENKTEKAITSNIEHLWNYLPNNGREAIINKCGAS